MMTQRAVPPAVASSQLPASGAMSMLREKAKLRRPR
jgi:hypothetical protein